MPLLRGERRPRVALVGRQRTGKSTIFRAASSAAPSQALLAGESAYEECLVGLGLEEISLVDLPVDPVPAPPARGGPRRADVPAVGRSLARDRAPRAAAADGGVPRARRAGAGRRCHRARPRPRAQPRAVAARPAAGHCAQPHGRGAGKGAVRQRTGAVGTPRSAGRADRGAHGHGARGAVCRRTGGSARTGPVRGRSCSPTTSAPASSRSMRCWPGRRSRKPSACRARCC